MRRRGERGSCVAVTQVVVVDSGGGGKLWSRARVCVSRSGAARKKAGGGISGSLLRATRELCRGGGREVRRRGGTFQRRWEKRRLAARSLSRAPEERAERAIPVLVVEIAASYVRVDVRACVHAWAPGREDVSSRKRERARVAQPAFSTVVRAPQDGLNVFSRVWFWVPPISDVIRCVTAPHRGDVYSEISRRPVCLSFAS